MRTLITLVFYFIFFNLQVLSENNPIIYITPYGSELYSNKNNLQNQYIDLSNENISNLENKNKIFNFSNQIDVDLSNSDYGHKDLNINGGDPNFTIISLDGLQLNNHANSRGGSFNLRDLSFKNIDQINFISGTNAQTLGSGAMSGFLNLNLGNAYFKDDQKINFDKSLNSNSLTYVNKKNFNQFSSKNKISYFEKENADTGENLKNVNLINKLYFENNEILIGGLFTNALFFPDDSGGNIFSANKALQDEKTENLFFSLKKNKVLTNNIKNFIQYDFLFSKDDINKPVVPAGVRSADPETISNTIYKNSRIKNYYNIDLNEKFAVDTGLEFNIEKVIDESDYKGSGYTSYEDDRKSFSFYNSFNYDLNKNLFVNLTGRSNKSESYKNKNIYSASINYINKIGEFNLSQGTGFKIPSFYALNNGLVGDTSLVPETNLSKSLTFKKEITELNIFNFLINRTKFKNLINYSSSKYKMVNEDIVVNDQYIASIESKFNDKIVFKNSINFLKSNIKNSSDQLRKRPEYKLLSSVAYNDKGNTFYFGLKSVGKSFDSSIPTGNDNLDSYEIFDMFYKKQLTKKNYFKISIDNVLDKDYQKSIGFNDNGRNINISFTGNF
jgi:outer membrane cobalamin receptor